MTDRDDRVVEVLQAEWRRIEPLNSHQHAPRRYLTEPRFPSDHKTTKLKCVGMEVALIAWQAQRK